MLFFIENKDSIEFNKNTSYYLSRKFLLKNNIKSKKISFNESLELLETYAKKYTLQKYEKMEDSEKNKIDKISLIILEDLKELFKLFSHIKFNKMFLTIYGVVSIEKIESITRKLSVITYIFSQKNKNKGLAINLLKEVFKTVEELGNYNGDLNLNPSFFEPVF